MAGRLNYEKLNKSKQISRHGFEMALFDLSPAPGGGKVIKRRNAVTKGKDGDANNYSHAFLSTVVDKIAKGETEPAIPRKAPHSVRRSIEAAGGVFLWAKAQPRYRELLQKKNKKLRIKGRKEIVTAQSISISENIEILKNKVAENEEVMRRAKAEYVKRETIIRELNRRIAILKINEE